MTDLWESPPDTSSATDETSPLFTKDDFDYFSSQQQDVGTVIDGEIVDEPKTRSRLKSEPSAMLDRSATSNIPKIDEWMHFFSRVLIRGATDYYIDLAFRGIDENLLTDREVDRIKLDDTERDRIARPFAEYSNKSKFMRKHGRMIIASADSVDAMLQLGLWFSRVNRIARKYAHTKGTVTPRVYRAAPVFRPAEQMEDTDYVGSGPGTEASQNGHGEHWRPDIGGQVFNPNLG